MPSNDDWIICFHCGRVSLRPEWDAADDRCPYDGCDGAGGDDLPWDEVRKHDDSLPEHPKRDVSYSALGWWEMRKRTADVEAEQKRYAAYIEEGIRRLAH